MKKTLILTMLALMHSVFAQSVSPLTAELENVPTLADPQLEDHLTIYDKSTPGDLGANTGKRPHKITISDLFALLSAEENVTLGAIGDGTPTDGTNDPAGPFTAGDSYIDSDAGSYWVYVGTTWQGPFGAKNYIYGVAAGQSNMLNRDPASNTDNYTYDKVDYVQVWNPTSQAWEAYDPAVNQFTNEDTPDISPAIYGARKLAEDTGSVVRLFMSVQGGRPISDWTPTSGTRWSAFNTDYANAGSPHLSFVWWLQGENNNSNSSTPLTKVQYKTALTNLIAQYHGLGQRGSSTIFIAGSLSTDPGTSNGNWYQNQPLSDLNLDGRPITRYVDFSSLGTRAGDPVHYNAQAAVEQGTAFADAFRTPTDKCGVVLDLKADEGITASGTDVSVWTDDERDIAFSADSGNPQSSTLSDGRPAIDMNGGRFSGAFRFKQQSTVFVLYESVGTSTEVFFEASGSAANDVTGFVNSSQAYLIRSGTQVTSANNVVPVGEPTVATFEFAHNSSRVYQNNQLVIDSSNTGDNNGGATFHVGNSDSTGSASNVKIARVIVYNCLLTDVEREKVSKALQSNGGGAAPTAIAGENSAIGTAGLELSPAQAVTVDGDVVEVHDFVGNSSFADDVKGDDATAASERSDLPAKTLQIANNNVVLDGTTFVKPSLNYAGFDNSKDSTIFFQGKSKITSVNDPAIGNLSGRVLNVYGKPDIETTSTSLNAAIYYDNGSSGHLDIGHIRGNQSAFFRGRNGEEIHFNALSIDVDLNNLNGAIHNGAIGHGSLLYSNVPRVINRATRSNACAIYSSGSNSITWHTGKELINFSDKTIAPLNVRGTISAVDGGQIHVDADLIANRGNSHAVSISDFNGNTGKIFLNVREIRSEQVEAFFVQAATSEIHIKGGTKVFSGPGATEAFTGSTTVDLYIYGEVFSNKPLPAGITPITGTWTVIPTLP